MTEEQIKQAIYDWMTTGYELSDGDIASLTRFLAARFGIAAAPTDDLTHLTVEQVDRLAQERPPYPAPSANPRERCASSFHGWHRPQSEDWNAGNRESTCTWCEADIERKFADGVWRTP